MPKHSLCEARCHASLAKVAFALLAPGLAAWTADVEGTCEQGSVRAMSSSLLQLGRRGESRRSTRAAHVQDVLPRMQYWKRWRSVRPLAQGSAGKGVAEKFLLFDFDRDGLNNKRIGWEVAATIAYQTNRTLVLPPPIGFVHIDFSPKSTASDETHESRIEDFINMDNLREGGGGLKVATFNEFVNVTQQDPDAVRLYERKKVAARTIHGPGEEMCDIARYRVEDELVYAKFVDYNDGRLFYCSDFSSLGQVRLKDGGADWKPSLQAIAIVHGGFVWHPDVFYMASLVVQDLGIFDYVSIHARYGDFQLGDWKQESASSIIDTWFLNDPCRRLTGSMSVYVSSDDTSGRVPRAFARKGIRVRTSLDYWADPSSPIAQLIESWGSMRVEQLKGPVEQLICAFGRVFIGTLHSTFTGYIQRMRFSADAPQTLMLYHSEAPSEQTVDRVQEQVRAWKARYGPATWEPPTLGTVPP